MARAVVDELAFTQVPHREDGRGMDGADCWGFARLVCASIGIDLPLHNDVSTHDRRVCEATVAGEIESHFQEVQRGSEQPGDLVHMWSVEDGKRLDLHIGVVVRRARLMHIEKIGGVQAVGFDHETVKNRILGLYRFNDQRND